MTSRLTCREVVELASDHLEGALEPWVHDALEWHCFECRDCTLYLEQLRVTVKLVSRTSSTGLSSEEIEKLVRAFGNR